MIFGQCQLIVSLSNILLSLSCAPLRPKLLRPNDITKISTLDEGSVKISDDF